VYSSGDVMTHGDLPDLPQLDIDQAFTRKMRFSNDILITKQIRHQVITNLERVIGESRNQNSRRTRRSWGNSIYDPEVIWTRVVNAVSHELEYIPHSSRTALAKNSFSNWFLDDHRNLRDLLKAIEIAFSELQKSQEDIARYQDDYSSSSSLEEAIVDVNERFKQFRLPYTLSAETLTFRNVQSEYLFTETVVPVLRLVREQRFMAVEQEFNEALGHQSRNDQKSALVSALNAFESTIKQICDERSWAYDKDRATASKLIQLIFAKGLLPPWFDQQFTHLRMLLESGTPTVRNKLGGHGGGSTPIQVPEYLVAYAIHTAAANIVLMIEAHLANPVGFE